MQHKTVSTLMRLTLLPMAGLALAALGCSARNGIVGKWRTTIGSVPGTTATVEVVYNPDGTTSSTITTPQQETKTRGTYTLSGDVVTETITAISINGRNLLIPATANHTEAKHFQVDGQTLTYSDSNRPGHLTLTRLP